MNRDLRVRSSERRRFVVGIHGYKHFTPNGVKSTLSLVEEIWDTIAEENQAFELSDSQKRELDRRLETARSKAGQAGAFGRTWEKIKAEFIALLCIR